MPLLKGVRREACHVYSWGNPDEADSDENVCHVWGGVPTHIKSLEVKTISIIIIVVIRKSIFQSTSLKRPFVFLIFLKIICFYILITFY